MCYASTGKYNFMMDSALKHLINNILYVEKDKQANLKVQTYITTYSNKLLSVFTIEYLVIESENIFLLLKKRIVKIGNKMNTRLVKITVREIRSGNQ